MKKPLKLGLIGDNIAASQSPKLHRIAGQLTGFDVQYDLLIPAEQGQPFDDLFASLRARGYHGVNVTYPYKTHVSALVDVADPVVRAIGAVNTVVLSDGKPQGFNTDYSGFIRAYRAARGDAPAGCICLIGAGGVGKAIAFALLGLGAQEITCVDLDPCKAQDLAEDLSKALTAAGSTTRLRVSDDPVAAASNADGIINCTPVGMVNIGGTPIPASALSHATWAFDAVYTPVETPFLRDAARAGLSILSGYELFLGQGIDAWARFSGQPVEEVALRQALSAAVP